MGKTSAAVKNRYNAKTYDRISLLVPKGKKDIIKAAADSAGETVNSYIARAVDVQIQLDNAAPAPTQKKPRPRG